MSVKEFFGFGIIKQKVVDFLKAKGDFDNLASKHKKPFRGHINKIGDDFYACDDFHQVKCFFSDRCKEQFERKYPQSVKIHNIVNMLICVQEFQLLLKQECEIDVSAQNSNAVSGNSINRTNQLECVLQVDDLQVISFDRFTLKDCANVAADEQVKIHINFVMHFQIKKSLLQDPKYQAVPQITQNILKSEEAASPFQQRQIQGQQSSRFQSAFKERIRQTKLSSDDEDHIIKEKLENNDQVGIVQFKDSPNEKKKKPKKRELRKHMKNYFEGFQSCDGFSDNELIDNLELEAEPVIVNMNRDLPKEPTYTQKQRDEELKKIDEYMEGIYIEEISSSQEAEEESKKSRDIIEMSQNRAPNPAEQHSIEPSQEQINTCSKAYLEQQERIEQLNKEQAQKKIESLEEILGEAPNESSNESKKKSQHQSQNVNNQEILSNPSSALENEKIVREHELTQNKDKIELEIELTEDQKKQEQNLNFGSLPQGDLIGIGLNQSSKQRELRESKRQGQGGQHSAKKNSHVISTQDDLLDYIDSRTNEEKEKEREKIRQAFFTKREEKLSQSGSGKKPTQLTIMSMFQKRDEKNSSKQEQKTEKLNKSLNNAQEFNQFKSWTKEHDVQSGASNQKVKIGNQQIGKKRGRPPSKTKGSK